MGDFLTFGLSQTLTHWRVTGVDGFNKPTYAAPVQLACRWEDRVEKIQNDQGQDYVAKSRIFLGTDIVAGDYVMLGTSAELDPRKVTAARRVVAMRKTPGIYAESFERKAYL